MSRRRAFIFASIGPELKAAAENGETYPAMQALVAYDVVLGASHQIFLFPFRQSGADPFLPLQE